VKRDYVLIVKILLNEEGIMNKNLFKSQESVSVMATDTVNVAGGKAYALSDHAALAQYAMTGCFNGTYYCQEKDQLTKVLALANRCDPKFVAKVACYSREKGLMKDMPAFLAAAVASKDTALLSSIFARVIDSPKMLRNFVQITRSGVTGRKSFGTRPKRLIQQYLENLSDIELFNADVGNDPSLQDIIKMVRPKPSNVNRNALHAYLLDKEYNAGDLSPVVRAYEDFKKDPSGEMPKVPFQKLDSLPLTDAHWAQIAENASWTQTRMNLNTFLRHNVFGDGRLVELLALRLENADLIKSSKVFSYQLFSAFKNVDSKIPQRITVALQRAAEIAIQNIPEFAGNVYVLEDISGSMRNPVTGNRAGASSKVSCLDVAALFAASVLRKNPEAKVIPFSDNVVPTELSPLDSIMTNATKLASLPSGGTNCSAPLTYLNMKNAKGDLVIYVSDNESWMDSNKAASYYNRSSGTQTMDEWKKYKQRNPKAKLVCIDITPGGTSQTQPDKDILNIGGFSDNVFEVISKFVESGNEADFWVKTIEAVKL